MKPEIKELWIEALLSGKYKKGQGNLHTWDDDEETERFCCLGVLCDLAVKKGVPIEVERDVTENGHGRWSYNGCTEYLPLAVADWAEIPTQGSYDLVLSPDGKETLARMSLAELNDEGYSFEELVDEIREYF